jgi:hypothetical protein
MPGVRDGGPCSGTGHPAGRGGSIAFDVPAPGAFVTVALVDVAGRRVCRLIDGWLDTGLRATAGVYYVRLKAGSKTAQQSVVRMK